MRNSLSIGRFWVIGFICIGFSQVSCKPRKQSSRPADGLSQQGETIDDQSADSVANQDQGAPTHGFPFGEAPDLVVPSKEGESLGLAGIVNPYPKYLTKFLGDGFGTAARLSPKYRFRYYDNGFSPQTPQAVSAMKAKITSVVAAARARGVPEGTISEFSAYTNGIAENPNQLGHHIDQAYEELHRKWLTCGGNFERVARAANITQMTITAQPAPFYICGTNAGCTWAAAMENGTYPAQVHASIVYLGGWDSQPTRSYTVTFKNLVRWELGNWFGRLAGHRPRSVAEEFGDKPPCGYTDDRTKPVVSIASPANRSTATGVVTIKANATDNVGVKDVQFLVNNVAVAADASAPYEFAWNSATVPNGSHTITAVATDAAGLSSSVQLILQVNNRAVTPPAPTPTPAPPPTPGPAPAPTPPSVDVIRPTTTLTNPRANATVSGNVALAANATDNVGVAHVNFFVDGALVSTDRAAPYEFLWNSATVPNGSHVVMAAAADAVGLWSSSSATVTTQNATAPVPADTVPPVTKLTAPVNGARVSGMVTVNAQATDNVGVVLVNYFVDNAFVATDVTAPYSFTWDSRTVPNGSHVLMVASADARGLYSISSVTVNVAN